MTEGPSASEATSFDQIDQSVLKEFIEKRVLFGTFMKLQRNNILSKMRVRKNI